MEENENIEKNPKIKEIKHTGAPKPAALTPCVVTDSWPTILSDYFLWFGYYYNERNVTREGESRTNATETQHHQRPPDHHTRGPRPWIEAGMYMRYR